MTSITQPTRNTPRWSNLGFLLALLLSSALVISWMVLWRVMPPIYEDFELDLPWLTLAVLKPITGWMLGLLPTLVLIKERSAIVGRKRGFDTAVSCLSILLGLIVAIAYVYPLVIIDDSLVG